MMLKEILMIGAITIILRVNKGRLIFIIFGNLSYLLLFP